MPDNIQGGSIEYQLTADNARLNAALDEAKAKIAELEAHANRGQHAVDGLGGAMNEMGHKAHSSLRVFERFIGVPAMIIGVATAAFEAGKAIREGIESALESAEEKAKKFLDTLDASKPTESLGKLRQQISTMEAQLSQSLEGEHGAIGRFLFGEKNPEELQKQLAELRKSAQSLQNRENAAEIDKRNKAEEKHISELEAKRDEARSASLDGAEKIEFDSARKVAALGKQLEAEKSEKARELIRETISWEYQQRNLKLAELADKDFNKRKEEAAKLQKEEEEKNKRVADEKADLESKLLEGREKIEFDTARKIKELQEEAAKETSEERKRLIQDEIKMEGKLREKMLSDIMVKQFTELKRMAEALEAGNNNVVYSLQAIQQQLSSISTRLSGP